MEAGEGTQETLGLAWWYFTGGISPDLEVVQVWKSKCHKEWCREQIKSLTSDCI